MNFPTDHAAVTEHQADLPFTTVPAKGKSHPISFVVTSSWYRTLIARMSHTEKNSWPMMDGRRSAERDAHRLRHGHRKELISLRVSVAGWATGRRQAVMY